MTKNFVLLVTGLQFLIGISAFAGQGPNVKSDLEIKGEKLLGSAQLEKALNKFERATGRAAQGVHFWDVNEKARTVVLRILDSAQKWSDLTIKLNSNKSIKSMELNRVPSQSGDPRKLAVSAAILLGAAYISSDANASTEDGKATTRTEKVLQELIGEGVGSFVYEKFSSKAK